MHQSPAPSPQPRAPTHRAFPTHWPARIGWILLAIYVVWAVGQLDVTWARFAAGIDNAAKFLGRMFPPDAGGDKWESLLIGMKESLQITFIATLLGIALSLPIGLMAARNLMPAWVVWPARGLIAVSRSFHEVVVAIIFVKAVGFGAIAGIGALVIGSIGFVSKLFAEAIEEINPKQVEAIRATGASFMSVVLFGVLPQVFSRFLGFATYQFDSNLRHSTMIGIVGAGGIGGTLFAAFQRFDYDFVCAILIAIIALIMLGEVLSSFVRALFTENLSVIEWFRRRFGQTEPERRDRALGAMEGS
ncbi:MAG: phosphonate ABC transporter, permease protein PhnE [Betaproteobacteria bacterium]|nr:phosphonate ABC transporter, permease protein PhnE [Betaproteobacteria bacterium]